MTISSPSSTASKSSAVFILSALTLVNLMDFSFMRESIVLQLSNIAIKSLDGKIAFLTLDQTPQHSKVLYVLLEIRSLGGFQAHGNSPEALIVHEQPEGLHADVSFADMLVAVHSRVKFLFRVIEVKGGQPF